MLLLINDFLRYLSLNSLVLLLGENRSNETPGDPSNTPQTFGKERTMSIPTSNTLQYFWWCLKSVLSPTGTCGSFVVGRCWELQERAKVWKDQILQTDPLATPIGNSATKKVHMIRHEAPLGTIVHGVPLKCVAPLPPPCDIVISEPMVPGAFSLSTTAMIAHSHSSFTSVVSLDSLQVGSRAETHTLSVRPEALTGYPTVPSPSIGVLIDLEAILICIVTIANAEDLATTCTPAQRTVETCVTQHKMFEWCVTVATAIFIDGCSCHQKVRRHRSRRRFAQPLSTIILKGAPCRLMSWHFSLFFETHYWHQKGRPGLSVSAASLCDLPAVTPTSGKTTCSQYLWYDALATTFCSYLGSAVTRRHATYTFE